MSARRASEPFARPALHDVLHSIDGVDGWMSPDQAEALYAAAAACRRGDQIVEIGSFRGRSTIVLASAAEPGVDVIAIDPHAGNDRGPQQWPFPAGADAGTARLYVDGVFATPDGRARFVAAPYVPVAEKPDARHPFRLNTGRLRDHWHGMSRTGTVAQLFQNAGEPNLQLHASDLARRGIAPGDLVRVESKRGRTRNSSLAFAAATSAGAGSIASTAARTRSGWQ